MPDDISAAKLTNVRALTDAIAIAKTSLRKHPGQANAIALQKLQKQRAALQATLRLSLV